MTNKAILAKWKKISNCIAVEITTNDAFAHKMSTIINGEDSIPKPKKSNRRPPPKFDPLELLEQGMEKLTETLKTLNAEELKDVIAANGMDSAKRVMKWKDRDRLEKHLIEETQRQAAHGKAFWNASGEQQE